MNQSSAVRPFRSRLGDRCSPPGGRTRPVHARARTLDDVQAICCIVHPGWRDTANASHAADDAHIAGPHPGATWHRPVIDRSIHDVQIHDVWLLECVISQCCEARLGKDHYR